MNAPIKPPALPQITRVRSGAVELAVEVHGPARDPGRRPLLILVHGYPDSRRVWREVIAPLAERYRVAAYDVRGAGESDAPAATSAYALEHLVADLAAVADALSPEQPFHLVAHDWGSIQSWEAVCTERLQQRIASFTSVSGPSLDHAGHWAKAHLRSAAPGRVAKFGRQLAHSWYIAAMHLPLAAPMAWRLGLDRLWPRLLERMEGLHPEPSPTQARDGQHGLKLYRANVAQRLLAPRERRTEVPVQLLVPRRDPFVSLDLLDGIRPWVKQLWRRDFAAGHWMPLSHPGLLARCVLEFVDFCEGGAESAGLRRARAGAAETSRRQRPCAGQLAIITGGGSGIGRETLLALAERGAEVVAADIDLAGAQRSAELAQLLGATAHARQVDVGDAQAMEAFAAWVEQNLGAPDLVVNNAGIGMAGNFLDTSSADWERILRVNLWGVIHGSRLFGRQMVAAGKAGAIVNVASALAFAPSRMLSAYATSKAAVAMLNDCLRAELAGQGIQVVSVCPGVIDTPITGSTRFVGVSADEQQRRRAGAQRLYRRRNLKPQAVAAAILKALERRQQEVLVGGEAHGARLLSRLSPALTRRLARMELSL
jgi:NAD(P)-dependent dehydrogenase (short-subunit alcohol dehydrogenase family)/pimeloyl-ACP methyl ester carboxylesterase